jgi:hypothetical protein
MKAALVDTYKGHLLGRHRLAPRWQELIGGLL